MRIYTIVIVVVMLMVTTSAAAQKPMPLLKVSDNKRFFQTAQGNPFFWLGDTGWLLFSKCNRADALQYLDARKKQGFNVIQVMVLHELFDVNVYGDSALHNKNIATRNVQSIKNYELGITNSDALNNEGQPQNQQPRIIKPQDSQPPTYDLRLTTSNFWNHIDFIVDEAAKRGIYMALVPLWGSNLKAGGITVQQAELYAAFLAKRYAQKSNIIWLNGGDIKGADGVEVWNAIGTTLRLHDPKHLITFHPRGRTSSSDWFHQQPWLDFNMFQSGHKDYQQDTVSTEKRHFGEDNWKYAQVDYALQPTKPTLDGEPSYENIPHGLHDSLEKRWSDNDLRRYAYWSVFAGGAGFTYGENAIMQFNTKGDIGANFGVESNWKDVVQAPGANQMQFLKALLLSKPYFERMPAQEIIADNNGEKYAYLLATKGQHYAFVYTYTGKNITINCSTLGFVIGKASWYNPRNGKRTRTNIFRNTTLPVFDPPGVPMNGNDWVLILEK